MKKALITGVTGQDGSYLAEFLLEKGYDVHGVIRRSSVDYRERIAHLEGHPNFHLHYGDLSDSMSILSVVSTVRPDEIYNLAAQSHVQVSFDVPEFPADVDATGVLRVLEAVRLCGLKDTCRIYQASTSELYGKVEEVPQNENTPFHPYSPYAVAKQYGFWIVKEYREAYNMFCCSGILFNHESERRGETFVTRKITLAEHGFHPVDEPSYDLVSVKKDEGFVATATVALQPELNLTQTTGFVVECVTPAVTDKEIDAVLERRRNAAAELVPHKGPAVKGNVVHMDFEGLLDGVAFQGGTAQNQSVQLGSGRMIPGFEDGILGHKAGDEFDIHVTFPERYHAKDLAGKAVVFKVKLHDVCVRQLPSMNSDFAKKVGGVDTMEEFREKVRKQLYDGRHGGALNRAKDQVLAKLADAAEGELPGVLVESTYQQEMQNIQQQLQMQRMSLDRYLSQIHQTRENFTANVHAAAEKNTRARMALLQVAQNEGLVPTDEEITKNLQERADRTKKTLEEVKANASIPAMQRSEAIRRAADWVIEHSTIEEK